MLDASYQFRARLQQEHEAQTNQRKGDRTRDRLKLATIDALSEIGYRDMKVTDICERAGVSSGTFYLYFQNKTEVTHVVLEEFIGHLDQLLSNRSAEKSAFRTLYQANLEWLKSIRANAGLFRCILQIGDASPELSVLTHGLNARWYRRIMKNVMRRFPRADQSSEDTVLLVVYALGSMMDEIAHKLVVDLDPHLAELVEKVAPRDEDFAELLSMIWYRTLYGKTPKEPLSTEASRLLTSLSGG